MTDLQKYQMSAAHVAAVRAAGFDARDPDARHPVRNPQAEKILAAKGRTKGRDARVNALLRAKAQVMNRIRGRGLGLLLTMALAATAASGPVIASPEAQGAGTGVSAGAGETASTVTSSPALTRILMFSPLLAAMFTAPIMITAIRRRQSMSIRSDLNVSAISSMMVIEENEAWEDDEAPALRCRWHVDGASRMGQVRSENQDAFRIVRVAEDRAILILCDGAGGVEGGKLAAETAAEAIASSRRRSLGVAQDGDGDGDCVDAIDWPAHLERAIAQARAAVTAEPDAGITTAIVAVLNRRVLHYATLGDGALTVIWPAPLDGDLPVPADFMAQELFAPHHARGQPSNVIAGYVGHDCAVPPRIGSVRLEPGCIVIAMSDGAGDLFPRGDFAVSRESCAQELIDQTGADPSNLESHGMCVGESHASLADRLLAQIEAARDPETGAYLHSDNMTLLIGLLEEDCAEAGDV